MSNVICIDCGATAISKCPGCRTVFPDNQMEAVLSHQLHFKVVDDKVVIDYTHYSDKESDAEKVAQALKALYSNLRMMQQQKHGLSFKGYACNHRWRFKEGEKSRIGCGCYTYKED